MPKDVRGEAPVVRWCPVCTRRRSEAGRRVRIERRVVSLEAVMVDGTVRVIAVAQRVSMELEIWGRGTREFIGYKAVGGRRTITINGLNE